MIQTAIFLSIALGMVTYYPAEIYTGNPLYCDTSKTELTYNENLSFVALPIGTDWLCGDEVVIIFLDGTRIYARALDSGTFRDNCIMHDNGQCIPILADLPENLWPYGTDILSARAKVVNLSLLNRLMPSDAKIGYIRQ